MLVGCVHVHVHVHVTGVCLGNSFPVDTNNDITILVPLASSLDMENYGDVKCQNEWLRETVSDPIGVYLFCI